MGLHVIPTDLPTLTAGERRVLEKLKVLYKDMEREAFLYIQPRIRNLEPDFILVDSKRGVTILEVKDWGISYINQVTQRKVMLNDGKEVDNPLFKTNQYYNALNGLFAFQESLMDDDGQLGLGISANVMFTNLSSKDITENNLHNMFQLYPSKYVSSDAIGRLEIDELFGLDCCMLTEDELVTIRTLLFPEIKITKKENSGTSFKETRELIRALDVEQEKFAKRLPYGHYMVTGVPGSGKTVILLARAIHLVRQHPDWKIRILTYNNSLKNKLNNSLDALARDLTFMDVKLGNIEVSTFHKFALEVSGAGVPQLKGHEQNEWWTHTLPSMALEKAKPQYDAILIDEYQDFHDDWIRVCIRSCKEHEFIDNRKETRKGINLFLAGDRLQSIYNTREHSWKEIGINMQGRSELLKKAYRSGNEHIDMALNFLKQNKSLEAEVNRFYSSRNELVFDNHVTGSVSFVTGALYEVAQAISELIYKVGYEPHDVLVLCKDWVTCRKLKELLPDTLQRKAEVTKEITGGKLVITTYHSSKGLEAPVTFLMEVDEFKYEHINQNDVRQRKLLYVGMTRASERLYIHTASAGGYGDRLREVQPTYADSVVNK